MKKPKPRLALRLAILAPLISLCAFVLLAQAPKAALAPATPVCNLTDPFNVTAASTSVLVAGIGNGTKVYVCGIVLTSTAAGTAVFTTGSGTTCGSNTVTKTGTFTLATGTPLVAISQGDPIIVSGTLDTDVCLAATGGTMAGFLLFARY
jgi:hypothetical protein